MERFYWVREDRLAGSSRPGGLRNDRLDADLIELHARGISAILSMTETPLDAFAVEAAGMTYENIPVDDFTAPAIGQILDSLDFIDQAHAENRAVLVHCAAGQGRSATILGAWLVRDGASADDAIAELRRVCDRAVENEAQIACLRAFERDRLWVV